MKFGRFLTPELTTVAQPIKEMGKCAVQMILGTVKELPRDRDEVSGDADQRRDNKE